MPEIKTYNLAKIHRVKKDYKKDKTELESIYKPIGISDEGEATKFNPDKFSLSAKTRAIQRSQSQQKIDYIRTSYAKLLGITPQKKEEPEVKAPEIKMALAKDDEPEAGGKKKKKAAKGLGNPIPKALDGFTNVFKQTELDNPFTADNWRYQISLSVFNRPKEMADRRPRTAKTTDELVKRLPGYKPPVSKDEDGGAKKEMTKAASTAKSAKSIVPIIGNANFGGKKGAAAVDIDDGNMIPKFQTDFQPLLKDQTDTLRQQQLMELMSLRDYLAKTHVKRDEKEKTVINIPHMKTFERAILLPSEIQQDIKERKYPEAGQFLMENPFPKKKKKKGGKKGKKKGRR